MTNALVSRRQMLQFAGAGAGAVGWSLLDATISGRAAAAETEKNSNRSTAFRGWCRNTSSNGSAKPSTP